MTVRDPAELSEKAWEHLDQAVKGGVIELESGREVVLGAKEMVHVLQWLATLKARRPRAVHKPEDFQPKVTKGVSDARPTS